ncbi:MAG TPA: fasciclin domain-containing protein [Longimicrobiales bacterium]|nr:fasciclin domain-containing protein [Longimicrobiales bacterium]
MRKQMMVVAAASMMAVPALAEAQAAAGAGQDLVEVAQAAGSFTVLLQAVEAAGLVDVLRGDGPFTVFAPTDAAFAKLPEGTVEALLADREALIAVLTYHVLPGRVMAAEVVAAGQLSPETVQGSRLTIQVKDGKVHVDEATVTTADVAASNGVIHVIDTVVIPGR